VLENREIKRIGSPEPLRVDIRVIAATNRILPNMVSEGTFRDDLYYRLNVGAIHLAPLRERVEDIEPLVGHFTSICNEKLGRSIAGVSPPVLGILMRYQWPGNVRELANVIERAMVVAKGSVILPEHLPPHLFEARPAAPQGGESARLPELSLESAEREQILRALQASGGKRIEAARLLGLSRRTLYRKLDRYGIA
jgi:two-component system response regulator AtoC